MGNTWLHRYAVLVACCTLFVLVAGGLVTSNDAALSVPDWPLSYGQLLPPMEGGIFYEHGHRLIAATVGLLTIGLAVWLWRVERRVAVRRFGLAALAAVIAQGLLGGATVLLLAPKPVSIAHACLAELFFASTVAIALLTSPARWAPVDGSPLLRKLAVATPVLVFAQVALGASVRHQAIGVIPHMLGAGFAAGAVMVTAMGVLMHHMQHAALRRAALASLSIVFTQLFLGIGAYMSRLATADAPQPMPLMVWFTVAHVAAGALALAASVALAIQIHRYVRPAAPALAGAA